jgi:tripartite-type tricarboxylate transporter receptor subunit TctC
MKMALAQDFPKRPIQIVCPFAIGGETDLVCRLAAPYLSRYLGQPVVVLNKPGGTVAVGADYCLKAPADGYTIFATTMSYALAPLVQKMPYTLSDFVGLGELFTNNSTLVVRKNAPWSNFKEFIEDAIKHPGTYYYGIPGAGSIQGLWWEFFKFKTGMKVTAVPYTGNSAILPALLGGDIQIAEGGAPLVLPHIKAGNLKALAIGERDPQFPGVMTFQEQGIEGRFFIWRGVSVRTGTPQKAYDVLEEAIKRLLNDKGYVEGLAKMGTVPGTMVGKTFDSFMHDQHNFFAEIIKMMQKK